MKLMNEFDTYEDIDDVAADAEASEDLQQRTADAIAELLGTTARMVSLAVRLDEEDWDRLMVKLDAQRDTLEAQRATLDAQRET